MTIQELKQAIVVLIGSIIGALCHANETWTVGSKVFEDKDMAVRAAMSSGNTQGIVHTEELFLTQGLKFKKVGKNKAANFKNMPFTNVSQSK